jgi:hypothetical protein
MIEDCFYESTNSEVVDFAFGACIGYLNIRGIFRNEKTLKVARFAEIIDDMKTMIKDEELAARNNDEECYE